MKPARDLQDFIEAVKGKLEAEGIDIEDYDSAIACLSQCVAPTKCIQIYEQYINY